MPSIRSTFATPASVIGTACAFSSTVKSSPLTSRGTICANLAVEVGRVLPRPLMMSGVRASSMRIESTSSTIAK